MAQISPQIDRSLRSILGRYQESFQRKVYTPENNDSDLLMDIFGITPQLKREHRQYWGRELGMCWERLVAEICRSFRPDYGPALRLGADVPCDFTIGQTAIDTKYRIGSGDSGTLRKFRSYGPLLREHGYNPVLLILREDNLRAAIAACEQGGWSILTGQETIAYLEQITGFNVGLYLSDMSGQYQITR